MNVVFDRDIIDIVKDGIIHVDNINMVKTYLNKEISDDRITMDYNRHRPIIGTFANMYNTVDELLGIAISLDIIDSVIYNGIYGNSINPTNEIMEGLDTILTNTNSVPEDCAIIAFKYKGIILGYILVIVDSRTTFKEPKDAKHALGGKVAYFVGIRKSNALLAAQQYLKMSNIDSPLREFRLSSYIIPSVEEYSKSLHASYMITTPLLNMMHILDKFFAFQGPISNTMRHRYSPPLYLMKIQEELILWKRI